MKLIKTTRMNPLDSVFDRFQLGMPLLEGFFEPVESANGEHTPLRLPSTNISETDDAFVFTLEMPGVKKNEIEVTLEGDVLTVKGGNTTKTESKGVLRREIRSTRFERSFTVGNDVDREKIKAKLEDGILTVTLPKAAERLGRKIDIQ